MLAEDPRVIFVGQAVKYPGTAMHETFAGIPEDRLVEFPVAENLQMGVCNGLALAGFIPICCFPRWNFALLAADQIINHLDKMGMKVIIRVGVGSDTPLDPGPQHKGDYSWQFYEMCSNLDIYLLKDADEIETAYRNALHDPQSTILTEYMDQYEA